MLNCMVTYRYADKKSHDNTMKEPTLTPLVNPELSAIHGGDSIIDTIFDKKTRCFSSLGNSIAKAAGTTAISAIIAEPAGKGKVLCPSVR